MPQQFDYPKKGWSTGNMRMAKKGPIGDPGYPIRELEGERKRRETKVSKLEQVPGQTGPEQRDDMHYSELERQIGPENAQMIREMDDNILHSHYVAPITTDGSRNKNWMNWEKMRQQLIDTFIRPENIMRKGPAQQSEVT